MPLPPDAVTLRLLRAGEFVAVSELPDASCIPRLEAAGYEIEKNPHRGCRLLRAPDRLIADDIRSRLPDEAWVREILVFQKTASTNDVVNGLGRDGAPEGVVVFAEEQTSGRGRLGRQWQSPPHLGLWFSVLLRPELPVAEWPLLTLWIAHAVAQGIRREAQADVMLKWPNDLYIGGKKLAGILVETSLGDCAFATAGIGLNVNHPAFPAPLDATATSLRIVAEKLLDRNALAAAILEAMARSYPVTRSEFQHILAWAREVDWLLGRHVSACSGSTTCEGMAVGIDDDGALLVRNGAGEIARVTSGEVTRFSTSPG